MKLKIDKFGPISNYTFDINDINLFIGESATGKSIVTKLIYICNTFIRFVNSKECDKDLLVSKFQLKVEQSFENSYSNIFQDAYHDFDFTFYYTDEKYIHFYHNYESGYKIKFSNTLKTEIKEIYTDFQKKFKEFEKNTKEELTYPTIYTYILLQEIRKIFTRENYIYIPAGRSSFTLLSKNIYSILENKVELDYIFTQFGNLFEMNKKKFSSINEKLVKSHDVFVQAKYKELLKGDYVFENDEDRLYINQNEFLPLNQISSGQQELLPALMILWSLFDVKTSTTIIFEEPEAHLFPKDQQRLIELLVYILNHNKTKIKFLITTHSPYVLETFNNHLKKDKIKGITIEDDEIQKLEPLNPRKLNAYLMEKENVSEILDEELGLIDDKLLNSFNDITRIYDKMRDIEWENKQ